MSRSVHSLQYYKTVEMVSKICGTKTYVYLFSV